MITDADLLSAIRGAMREVEHNDISINIFCRDVKKAIAAFEEQPTITATVVPFDFNEAHGRAE